MAFEVRATTLGNQSWGNMPNEGRSQAQGGVKLSKRWSKEMLNNEMKML
jgi:hypothetical protein